MKFIIFVLGLALCLTTSLTSAAKSRRLRTPDDHPSPMPDQIEGYTAYSLEQAKAIDTILEPFVSYSTTLVMEAVYDDQMFPENYSLFMRGAFRKSMDGGYETIYYYRAFNPKNSEGNIYYGTFTVFVATEDEYETQFLSYTVDDSFLRSSIYY